MRRAVEGACDGNRPPLRLARGGQADGPSGLRTRKALGRVSGHDAEDALRYLVAMKAREIRVRKLSGL